MEVSREDVPTDLEMIFGSSVEGRPLTVTRRGDLDGVRVLVIGCIHGNEADGMAIVEELSRMDPPEG
ncbi:MAG: hypothetical protein ACO38H_07120, partial [Ilumatobacteraceae bacterium]